MARRVLALAVLAAVAAGLRARQDTATEARGWPMLGGTPQRNMVNPWERLLPTDWRTEPRPWQNVRWVVKLGSNAWGPPAVAGGRVFVGTNNQAPRNPRDTRQRRDGKTEPIDRGVLMCFRESDGAFLWQAVHDKHPAGAVIDWPNLGIASTPAVDGDRVYYVSNRAELVCADVEGFHDGVNDGVQDEAYKDATDGDIVWRLDMIGALKVFPHNLAAGSPLIVGELVYVTTGNGVDEGHIHVPSPDAPSLIAVHKTTGRLAWKCNLPSAKLAAARQAGREAEHLRQPWGAGHGLMHATWSNVSYTEEGGRPQVLFPGGDGWLYSLDPKTGEPIWKFDANPKDSKYELGGRGTRSDFVLAAPAVRDGRLYIGTGQDPEHFDGVGQLWCIDLARAVALGRTNPDCDVSPVGNNFDPAAPANRARSAFVWHFGGPEKDPQKAGRDYVFGRTLSTCAIQGGLCYACDLVGILHCLDARTGKLLWKHDTKSSVWGSPLWVDEKIYLTTEDGDVWAFAHGRELRVLNRVTMETSFRAGPVAANGTLYLTTESRMTAVEKR